jgi:hypothetical protein
LAAEFHDIGGLSFASLNSTTIQTATPALHCTFSTLGSMSY